jgi:predicted O-linked N-acetylglucosamine transferase (SPINDLY family)
LPELITTSLQEYEAAALGLAKNPDALKRHREQLLKARDHAPLFNVDCYRRRLEDAYRSMWDRCQRGDAPVPIVVST